MLLKDESSEEMASGLVNLKDGLGVVPSRPLLVRKNEESSPSERPPIQSLISIIDELLAITYWFMTEIIMNETSYSNLLNQTS